MILTHIETRLCPHLLHKKKRRDTQLLPTKRSLLQVDETPPETHTAPAGHEKPVRTHKQHPSLETLLTTQPSSCANSSCRTCHQSVLPGTALALSHPWAKFWSEHTHHRTGNTTEQKMIPGPTSLEPRSSPDGKSSAYCMGAGRRATARHYEPHPRYPCPLASWCLSTTVNSTTLTPSPNKRGKQRHSTCI
jgi:hypothetical protein